MVPGERERATRDVAPVKGRGRWAPLPVRSGSRRRSAVAIAAVAAVVAISAATPAEARQGNPPPGERRPSLDRHAQRRAALERQRTGEATPTGVEGDVWPGTGYGALPWQWPGAQWGWPGAAQGWSGAWWGGPGAPWGWPYGGTPWGWPNGDADQGIPGWPGFVGPPGPGWWRGDAFRGGVAWWRFRPGAAWRFGGAYSGIFAWPYGAGSRFGIGAFPWRYGIEAFALRGFWCYASPGGRGRAPGGRDRGPAYWGCGPSVFPYVAPGQRLETPYNLPWGWPYVPRHRFEGRFSEEAGGVPTRRDGGLPSYSAGVPTPTWPGAAAAYATAPGGADCAFVVIEVTHGGAFRGWIQPSRFGAEEPREVELAIDALFSRGLPLVLMAPDGYAVRVPAGLPIESIRVAPCNTTR